MRNRRSTSPEVWSGIEIRRRLVLLALVGHVFPNVPESPLLGDRINQYETDRNDPIGIIDPDGRSTAGCIGAWLATLGYAATDPFACPTIVGCIPAILLTGGAIATIIDQCPTPCNQGIPDLPNYVISTY